MGRLAQKRRLWILAVAALFVGLTVGVLGGCESTPAGVVTVTMENLRFNPSTVTIDKGTTVRWVNKAQFTAHTSTANGWSQGTTDPLKWNSMPMNPGDTFEHTFDTPGSFDYFCMVHPYMTGIVEVRDDSGQVPSTTTTESQMTSTTGAETTTTSTSTTEGATSTEPPTETTAGATTSTAGSDTTTGT